MGVDRDLPFFEPVIQEVEVFLMSRGGASVCRAGCVDQSVVSEEDFFGFRVLRYVVDEDQK